MIALALALAATSAGTYTALGTEPFWSLALDTRRVRFERAGERAVVWRTPARRALFKGVRYVARGRAIDITHARCSDGMSDRVYPDRVTVRVGGSTYHGCGGAALGSLEGSSWRIIALNGGPPASQRAMELRFADGRISGTAGCNAFGGRYRVQGDHLIVGALISTKMACVGPGMASERAVFAILARPATLRWQNETVVLGNVAGSLALRHD